MFCTKCGSNNPDSSSFCQRCGAPILSQRVSPAEAPHPQPKKAESKPVSKPAKPAKTCAAPAKASGGTKVLTALLCVVFCLFFLLTCFIGLTRSLLQEDTLTELLAQTEPNEITFTLDGEKGSLPELIYGGISSDMQDIFTKKVIRKALESKQTRKFLVETVLGYTDYFTCGSRMHTVDASDFADFIDENISDFSDGEMDWLSNRQYSSVVIALEDTVDFDALSASELRDTLGAAFPLVRFAFTGVCYWLLFALCVVLFALILLINRRNICRCVPRLGATFLVLGSMLLLVAALCVVCMLVNPLNLGSALSAFLGWFAAYFALRGGSGFALGLICCIVSKALRKRDVRRLSAA